MRWPTRSESRLPQGPPAGRGRVLDKSIPGQSTFNKPEDDIRPQQHRDRPIYQVDDPGDVQKDRSSIDVNEDAANIHDSYGFYGRTPNDTTKTKYPYRDGIPNKKYADLIDRVLRAYYKEKI